MAERTRSAAIFVPPLLVVVVLGGPWITALVLLVGGLAAYEALRLLRAAGYPVLVGLGVTIALALIADAAVPVDLAGSAALVAAVAMVLAAVGAFGRADPREGLAGWLGTVLGGTYAGMLGFIVRIGLQAPPLPTGAALATLGAQRGWVLLLILAVWAYDTGAYLAGRTFGARVGRLFGRERFLEQLSPSKTYAGLFGGLLAGSLVMWLGLWALGAPVWHAVLLGPAVGLAAQAGDLAESMLKRAAGTKDSGRLLPGHGGVLDRVDSFLFAAPVVSLYVVAFLPR